MEQKKTATKSVNVQKKSSTVRKGRRAIPKPALEFMALGGLGEIGKNMYLLKMGDEMILIDCGLKFPDEDMLGIDFVIPDVTYLVENKHKLKAIFITHGHEDHIGALPFVLPQVDVPVYSTRLTLGLIDHKMKEATPRYKPDLRPLKAGDAVQVGKFKVRLISVCHSIPDSVALAIETPYGVVIHTGDYKLDPTPVDGRATDYATFAKYADKGVLLLCSDSTNAEKSGFTPSEKTLVPSLERILRHYPDRRLVISSFASNLHRVQLVLDMAEKFNRKVAFVGRSMVNNVALATDLGYLKPADGVIVPIAELDRHEPHELIVMTTGSQGEPFSGLVLMSRGQHHRVKLGASDVVAVLATPIPGNERMVSSTIDCLFELGCEVIYERDQQLHVSGHASREEMKFLLNLTKPRYFMPIHGEYRMLVRHGQLAEATGVESDHIFVMKNGQRWSYDGKKAIIDGDIPSGVVLVDGLALGEKESSLLSERQELAENGVLVVSLLLDAKGKLSRDPQISSYGQVPLSDIGQFKRELGESLRRAVKKCESDVALEKQVVLRSREILRKHGAQNCPILPLINRI